MTTGLEFPLITTTAFFLVAWAPTSFAKKKTYGVKYLLSNRDPETRPELPLWAQRAERAYENLKSYFPGFVVAVLLLIFQGKSSTEIQVAAWIYFAARLAHFTLYTLGNPAGRAAAWATAMLANLYLLYSAAFST